MRRGPAFSAWILVAVPAFAFAQSRGVSAPVPVSPTVPGVAPAQVLLPLAAVSPAPAAPAPAFGPLAESLPVRSLALPLAEVAAPAAAGKPGALAGSRPAGQPSRKAARPRTSLGRLAAAAEALALGGRAAEPSEILGGLFGERQAPAAALSAPPVAPPAPPSPPAGKPGSGRRSGLDATALDRSARPQDDFFRFANGAWLESFKMPADESRHGSFDALHDKSQDALKRIIDEAAADPGGSADRRRVAELYNSFMDVRRIESLGLKPVESRLRAIEGIKSKASLPRVFASNLASGGSSPVGFAVGQDLKAPARHIGGLYQTGLGLPDRDYYFNEGEEADNIRGAYLAYLTKLFALAGEPDAGAKAQRVYALEKALAGYHWTNVENRDSEKTYNKTRVEDLAALAPGFGWARFLKAAGLAKGETHVDVGQPSYLTGLARLVRERPLEDWKLYLKARELDDAAPYLTKAFVDARFDFYGRTLNGQPEPRPRWKRGISLVEGSLGEVLGKLYVERHFPPEAKERARRLIDNLRAAYVARIKGLAWMSDRTKAKALEKLERLTVKIGYPDSFRDYSKLDIRAGDLVGNLRRSSRLEYRRMLAKLGRPVDRSEWGMDPQTVNAYYNPVMNEIVFPAAILQAPFFDSEADDAVNYGAIGAIIGHEISHGFDDEGSKFDATGALGDWWTPEDRAKFEARGERLVKQADAFEALPGKFVNGKLTLGENIADLGGLTIAYDAYRLSLGGREAQVIDGFTGDQRFFLGWAQAWKTAQRDEALAQQMATDPHAPEAFRVNGVLSNLPAFHRAFGVKPGDRLYRREDERAAVW